MQDTVVISREEVCCSVVFGTLVGVSMFGAILSELMMTSAISYPLWSSEHECQKMKCAVSRRYINVLNSDVYSVVNLYLDHLKLSKFERVVCINDRRYVCCVMNQSPVSCDLSVRTVVKVSTL